MPENSKPRPAVILLERYEAIGGWIYLPLFILVLPVIATIAAHMLGFNVLRADVQLYLSVGLELFSVVLLAVLFHRYLGKSFRQARRFPGRFAVAVLVGLVIYYFGTTIMSFLTQLIEPGLENINASSLTLDTVRSASYYFSFSFVSSSIASIRASPLLFRVDASSLILVLAGLLPLRGYSSPAL